jgi:hypothetical protein
MNVEGGRVNRRRIQMSLSRRLVVGLLAALAIAVPVALADVSTAPTPAQAFGVICQRPPHSTTPGTANFSNCVRALAKGVRGTVTADDAARVACRQATPPLPGDEFGRCVASTKTLVFGLRALRAE